MARPDLKRQRRGLAAYERGLWAETLAALWLMLRAYRIVGRRVKTRAGEIDLIARRGGTLAFIEVKARGDVESAAQALGAAQRERLMRAASLFVAGRPRLQALDMRFDVMLVAPRRWPRHIPDAWQA
ncbi:MAG: YraN family protein [Parvibaculum sp.]